MRASPLILLLCLLCCGCKDEGTPPPSYVSTIQLSMEDASCTEAWLKVSLTDSNEPRTVAIQRDGQRVLTAQLATTDSLLVVEGLLPRRAYSFIAQRLRDSTVIDASAPAQATTMDTTSHNLTWQMDTLGVTASTLNDVAIINDTLAYAVGELYLRDSTGQIDPEAYNMAKWNGVSWQLIRIQFYTICGQSGRTPYPAISVIAFGANDVWIAMRGDQVARWNGSAQTSMMCLPVSFTINRMWGENANSMFAVGATGNIMHYNGSTWHRVESGTTLAMRDIWGATNARTGEREILALASTYTPELQGSMVFRITGNSATSISTTGMSPDMFSIWFVPGRRYYAVGAGIHQKRMLSDSAWSAYAPGVVTRYFSGGVRGQDVNDVFVVGSFGEVVHFNGQSWFRYFSDVPLPSGYLGFVAIKNNLIMATGQLNGQRGIVLIGRR
jgi:hypothetical protein